MLADRFARSRVALIGFLTVACVGAQQAGAQAAPTEQDTATQHTAAADSHHAMTNADVVEMLKSHLDEATVVSAIQVNDTQFDVSPQALIALKRAGLDEPVIGAMLEAARRKQGGVTAASGAAAPTSFGANGPPAAPVGFGGTTAGVPGMPQLDPQTAARMQAAMAQLRSMGYGTAASMPFGTTGPSPLPWGGTASISGPTVRVFLLAGANRTELVASYAERAMSKVNSGGPSEGATLLRSIASEGLRFAAIGAGPGGMAAMSGFSMLGRFMPGTGPSRPTITYAWGLPGTHSNRVVEPTPAFELRYADIPGIDPDAYEPVLLRLVLTKDNYRLLGATRQKLGTGMGMMAAGGGSGDWVAEDRVPAKLHKQERGFYTVQSDKPLAVGEYALVLRPVKGYRAQPSGFGGGEQLSAAAWDFSTPLASR
jgi:hypothetical protein